MHEVKTCSCCSYRTHRTQWVLQQHLPHRPQSAHETISSHLPVFLFSISSPRQKSQYLLALTDLLDAAAADDDAADIERATAAARLLTAVIQKQYQIFINIEHTSEPCTGSTLSASYEISSSTTHGRLHKGYNTVTNEWGTSRTSHDHNDDDTDVHEHSKTRTQTQKLWPSAAAADEGISSASSSSGRGSLLCEWLRW